MGLLPGVSQICSFRDQEVKTKADLVKLLLLDEDRLVNPVSFSTKVDFPMPTSPIMTTYGAFEDDGRLETMVWIGKDCVWVLCEWVRVRVRVCYTEAEKNRSNKTAHGKNSFSSNINDKTEKNGPNSLTKIMIFESLCLRNAGILGNATIYR